MKLMSESFAIDNSTRIGGLHFALRPFYTPAGDAELPHEGML